jgi:hypothetical protein
MKQVAILGQQHAAVREVEKPKAKENWVVVKLHSVPMCAEYKQFKAGESVPTLDTKQQVKL